MKAQGLYDPSREHDACGVAFVARLNAPPSHEVIRRALAALERARELERADRKDGRDARADVRHGFRE